MGSIPLPLFCHCTYSIRSAQPVVFCPLAWPFMFKCCNYSGLGINNKKCQHCVSASQQPGKVTVMVSTQDGRWLGMTYFEYIDEIQEALKQLVKDPALQSLYFSMCSQQYGILGTDCNITQNQGVVSCQDQGTMLDTLELTHVLAYNLHICPCAILFTFSSTSWFQVLS